MILFKQDFLLNKMNYDNLSKNQLIILCKTHNIKGYSNKNKSDIIQLLTDNLINNETPDEPEQTDMLNMIDLFCGTGAFSLAFQQTNKFKPVFSNDMISSSKNIYDINFNHQLTLGDINDIDVEDIPNHDILTGGFPCQPFSIAGNREGFNDERSNVFWKIIAILNHHKPRFFVLENVKNLLTHDNKNTFNTIKTNLKESGYLIIYNILDTAKITKIPQHRERLYIVGFRDNEDYQKFVNLNGLNFPDEETLNISDMLEQNIDSKYYYTQDKYPNAWELIKDSIVKENTIYQYRRVYVRENKSNLCPTLTANMGTGGHNVPLVLDTNGIRKLTPKECFNFQGFPKSFKLPKISDAQLYKLAGNAVSLPVVKLIANRITQIL